MSARRRRRKRPTTVSTIRPLPDATARVLRDGDETRGKKTRARALCSGRDEIRTIIPSERERDQFKAQKCTQTSAENHSAEKKKKTHRRVVLADFAATTFAPVKLVLCAANIMSRRVVFCCGAFRAKLRSFRGRERERDRERKREGKAPTKFVSFFPLISSLSLFFFRKP